MKGKEGCVLRKIVAAVCTAAFVLASSLSCLNGSFIGFRGGRAAASAETYEFAKTVDYSSSRLLAAPTVTAELTSARNLYYVSADNDERAAVNAWYYLDGEGNATGKDGKVIEPLETALDELDGGAIPNFYVSSEEQLAALSAYAASHQKLTDAAVISPDAQIVKAAKTAMP